MKRSNIYLPMAALILTAALAVPAAAQKPVKMRFSGSIVPTAISVQPNTITDEELLAGKGTLGPFTLRKLRTDGLSPQPSNDTKVPFGSVRFCQEMYGGFCCPPPKSFDRYPNRGHLSESYRQ